jgi:iron complex transport system ATP-binding protein
VVVSTPALDVRAVTFAYPGAATLLDAVSFAVDAGESLCLLGPNGAGKSTLLRLLLALERPRSGEVRIHGRDAHTLTRRELARDVAYVPQAASMVFPFSVLDVVLMARTPHLAPLASPSARDERAALAALDQVGLAALAARPVLQLSGGERQLVLIARALCQEARVLIMDEPTASLDYGNQIRVLRIVGALQQRGYAVVMSAHNPDHAFAVATHAAILQRGRLLAFGTPAEVITTERLSALYGAPIHVVPVPVPAGQGREAVVCVPRIE